MASILFRQFSNLASVVTNYLNIDRRRAFERDAIAILALGAAVFIWIALAGFQPQGEWLYGSSTPHSSTANIGGAFGNQVAGLLFFYFGITSWAMPMAIIQFASLVRRAALKENMAAILFGWIILLGALMPVLVSLRPSIKFREYSFATGGAIGQISSEWCSLHLGGVGSHIILWSMLVSALVLISRLGLLDLMSTFKFGLFEVKKTNKPDATVEVTNLLPPKEAPKSFAQETSTPDLFEHRPSFSIFGDSQKTPPAPTPQKPISVNVTLNDAAEDQIESQTYEDQFASRIPYTTPPLDIFRRTDERTLVGLSQKELEATSQVLVKTLEDFGVIGKIVGWQPGPVVTVYEYQPDAGIKQSKILSLLDDIALSLKVDSIFIHPVSGKRALGIQVPNSRRDPVLLGDVLTSDVFQKSPSPMTFAMGKTINGTPYCSDLTTMPHLLAAGATGTGKSVAINALLCSIIMKSSPEDVRMILVDPKMLELSVYDGIPHLLMPVITEPDRASSALKWAANEMERRYKLMQHAQVRNIGGFNVFWDGASDARKNEIKGLVGDDSIQRLPYILLVIDELADLMLTAPKDVESSIQRLAQKARASGIHMVLATQRPSVDVITGVIKANLPCRLSFQVVSKHDSRTILDQVGSEKLLGKGDILLQRPGVGKLERLQGALVSDEEVLALVASAKSSYQSIYDERAMSWIDEEVTKNSGAEMSDDLASLVDGDPKWDESINIAKTHGVVSASFLQRHLKIGYNRAARIVEAMEAQGLVAKADGAKPRKWLGPT